MDAAYMTQEILVRASYPLEAHSLRDLYFMGKTQSLSMPSIESAALRYQARAPLLPSTERVQYGRSENKSISDKLSNEGNLLQADNKRNYSSFGYLASSSAIDRVNAYLQ